MNYIIVVEDDLDIREMIEIILTGKGFKVRSFKNSREFHQHLQPGHFPDLFILDIRLPDGNGAQICDDLKADLKTKHIPVILMSANANADVISNLKAEEFIAKPFDIDNFIATVSKQIRA